MREYYIDENGQKRRLRFNRGDVILCRLPTGKMVGYQITTDPRDRTLFGLNCLVCADLVAVPSFSKKHLQRILYSCNPYKVIKRIEIFQFMSSYAGEHCVSFCT